MAAIPLVQIVEIITFLAPDSLTQPRNVVRTTWRRITLCIHRVVNCLVILFNCFRTLSPVLFIMLDMLERNIGMKNGNKLKQNLKATFDTSKYMLDYVWRSKSGKGYILTKSFIAILNAVLPLGLVLLPGLIINELTGQRRTDVLIKYIAITAGIPLIQSIIISSVNVYLNTIRYKFMIKVKTDFISHCADMDYETMENPEIGVLKERAEGTMFDSLEVFENLSGLITALVSLIMCVSTITVLNPWILILVIISVALNYVNSKWLNQKTFKMNNEIQRFNRYGWPIQNYFSDVKYAKEIRLYNLKDYFINIYVEKRLEANKYGEKSAVYMRNSSIVGSIISFVQTILLYIYFIYKVVGDSLSVGTMTIYMGLIMQFSGSLSNIARQYLNLSMLSLRVQELIKFMNIPLKNYKMGNVTPVFDSDSVIEFKNVSFKYPGSDRLVIDGLNLTVRGDEKLCIVGVNGSGKSTFVKLLMRLYVPTEGEILLNGININEYDYQAYCKLFAPVFQDFALYNITLGENIIMAEEYDRERLLSAARQSGLSAMAENTKYGFDTVIFKWFDEEGVEPSGGEGQRIATARALYRGGSFYILDEPTAALDPNAEYEIYTQFNRMIENKCAILITHRLSAVQLADKVAVFNDGHVAEYGTHAELYAKGGIYTEMFDKQARFYRDKPSESDGDEECE